MPVAHVQTRNDPFNSGGVANPQTTGALTITAGNLLIVGVAVFANSATAAPITSVKLDGTTDFTQAKDLEATVAGVHIRVSIWYLKNAPSGGSHTCQVNFNTVGAAVDVDSLWFTEASGCDTASPLDGTGASASGSDASPASGSYTTQTDSFIYGLAAGDQPDNPSTINNGSGWTIPTNGKVTDGSQYITGAVEYKANPGTSSHNAQFSWGTAADWVSVGVAFKVSGGSDTLFAQACL